MDVCKSFINIDRRRLPSARFAPLDIERPLGRAFPRGLNCVTAILSMIEICDLGRAFSNIAAMLGPGGLLYVVILDSSSERLRHLDGVHDEARSVLFSVGDEVVISSHFTVGERRSVCPYYRFLREPGRYVGAIQSAGLRAIRETPFNSPRLGGLEPRGILIEAENP